MTDFTIPDDLAVLLSDLARRENRPIEEIVELALRRYAIAHRFPTKQTESPEESQEDEHPFLVIARAADELGENSKEGNISERMREILATEFPEYLMRRMRGDYADEE